MECARVVALFALVVLVSAPRLPADTELRPGDTVRATLAEPLRRDGPPREVTGKVLVVDADSIVVAARRHAERVVLARSQIDKLEVRVRKDGKGRTALIGLAVGALIGGVFGYSLANDCSRDDFLCLFPREDRTRNMTLGATVAGAIGLGVGLVIGPGEVWHERPSAARRLAAARARRPGSGLYFTVGF